MKAAILRLFALLPAALCLVPDSAAQTFWPAEFGSTVNGFQDDFTGTSLDANWIPTGNGGDVYSLSGGLLQVSTAIGDPNHLLLNAPGYDGTTQEILARIRFRQFGTGDAARGGVGIGVDPGSSQGINFHFRDYNGEGQTGRHLSFLDDLRAWGPGLDFSWEDDTWYWIRLRQEPNAASDGGVMDVFAKIWPGDGSTPEPSGWHSWDYIPARSARNGLAGITAGSSGGASEFDVDYILIKAAGLPAITPAAEAFPLFTPGRVTIVTQPQSQTSLQCAEVSFKVVADGTPPYTHQWLRNGEPISGATSNVFSIANAQISDTGASYSVRIQNVYNGVSYSVTSANAILTVTPDTVPPVLTSLENSGPDRLLLSFSEPITAASASNRNNYQISYTGGTLPILSATLSPNATNVLLTTTGQIEGVVYTLTVNDIVDECTGSNLIAANTQKTFVSKVYASTDIGDPSLSGTLSPVSGGYNVSGNGLGISGASDQFQFAHQQRTGDFDIKIRLDSFLSGRAWAEAGLMAREALSVGSRLAAAFATPNVGGSFFKARTTASGNLTRTGSYPVNYPRTWLRLKRAGDLFTGYGSFDGETWTMLGSASISMPATVYLGFAVASHDSTSTATVAFRDMLDVTEATISRGKAPREVMGQSSRKTSLVFSEINYHPARSFAGERTLEFVELHNTADTSVDLSDHELDGDIQYIFPQGTVLAGGSFLVIARVPADVQEAYGLSSVLGPYDGNLPNDNGQLQLRNHARAVFLEVNYDTQPPWPVSPDGAGHSLVLARPSLGEDNPLAWAASDTVGGSPGKMDPIPNELLASVVINEILANTDEPDLDFLELYNHSNSEVDLSVCFLSDDPETNKFVIPPGTKIPARGFITFDQVQLGFSLDAAGETVFLRNAAKTRVIDAFRFGGQANGISFGRSPDGSSSMRSLAERTPGQSNAQYQLPVIVINEIMYNPISGRNEDEYIELYNRSNAAINLGGWQFVDGIEFIFPENTVINPNSYLVVSANASRMRANYSALNTANVVGDFVGNLSNNGERIALARPETQVATDSFGQLTTNQFYILVNEVTYGVGGRWGKWSARGGSSLELIDPNSDNSLAANWGDSDESAKGTWTTVSTTGVLDHGNVTPDQLQMFLQGAGECLVDNVEVLNSANANRISNSTFESGANGWTAEGTQQDSSAESSQGYNSARSYRIRASSRGDNQLNRIRTPLTSPLSPGSTATIRARVKWLRGHPEMLFRLRGNWVEAVCQMELPKNLGTPGERNSRFAPNNSPAIYDVAHFPILPAGNESVLVTSRVNDPNGIGPVILNYRADPSFTLTSVTMRDDGTAGDELANDGVYSARIQGQPSGTLVAFHIQATDQAGTPLTEKFPADAPVRECLVRFGETQPTGSYPVYRIWMTQATLNTWNSRSKLNNTPLDITFVLGDQRVIYNAQGLYAGSPYISPGYSGATSGRCGYSISFPDDDLFLGSNDLVLDWPGGHGNESTAIQEQMAYYIADRMRLPYSHRYFIRLHVNGVTEEQRGSIFEAVNQPDSEFINAWSPADNDGDFYKIDRAFEFNDNGGLIADPMPTLEDYTTTGGVKKRARYRWNWLKRATPEVNNFTNIFNLVDALNAPAPEPYTSATASLVDIEEWMGIFAVEHIINNFDSWGHDIGKNMYAYKPENGKWQLYMFDLDWLMLVATARYSASSGPLFVSQDPTVSRMYEHPPFRRAYFRAVQDAVNGPMLSANADAVMDEKYASLLANGVLYCDGRPLTSPAAVKTWFAQRRAFLVSQLAGVAATYRITTPTTINTSLSPVTISGTAPVEIKTIRVNGVDWPVTWTTISNWTIRVPLAQRVNSLVIVGLNNRDQLVPGASNTVTVNYSGPLGPQADIIITEWMASNTKTIADNSSGTPRYEDWFELYNAGETTVNLAGYFLTDDLANKTKFTIPAGYSIPPGGYLFVWADGEPQQNRPEDTALHAGFALSVGGEAIGLFAPDGTEVDSVTFSRQTSDISQGRCPDSGDSIRVLASPTPRTANDCTPVPPPGFQPVVLSGGQVTLSWTTIPGHTYQLEFSEDLIDWAPWGPPITASGESHSNLIDLSTAAHRFFRIQKLN